jgi:hypothetical protein
LDKVQVCLLSQPTLIPLLVLAVSSELNSPRLREMNRQYSPLHVAQSSTPQVYTTPGTAITQH